MNWFGKQRSCGTFYATVHASLGMTENGKLYVKNRIIIRFNLKHIFERVASADGARGEPKTAHRVWIMVRWRVDKKCFR